MAKVKSIKSDPTSARFQISRENSNERSIFDDGFDLEDLMLGQSPFASALATYNSVHQPNNQVLSTPNINPICHNQKNNCTFASNSCLPEEESFFNSFSESYNILDDFKPKAPVKGVEAATKQSKELCKPGDKRILSNNLTSSFDAEKNIHRRRDYSLSNDSGVEGCSVIDQTALHSNEHTYLTDSRSSAAMSQKYASQFTDMMNVGAPPCDNSDFGSNDNQSSLELQQKCCVSNDSEVDIDQLIDDSRKGSVDSDSGTNREIYGGGEMFSPDRFANGEMCDTKNASKKTAYNEKWGVKVLKAWCTEVNLSPEFEKQSATELNDMLCRFWSEVRKSNGDYYGRNSLFNLRAMINKHLKGKPYCVAFDIVTDERFRTSNEKLESQLKLLKGIGRTITHKQPISLGDLRTMYDTNVLGTSNPLALLRKVWFEITLHFCHKGAEAQEKLKKSSFNIFRDVNGLRYVARVVGVNDNEEIRMYETGGELCPVKSYELYLSKLHVQQPRLFQQPRRKSTPDSPMWYGKAPIGEKALQQMMANISTAARLSKRYTNHCVRTTALEQFSSSRRKNGGLCRSDRAYKTQASCEQQAHLKDSPRLDVSSVAYNTHIQGLVEQKKVQQHHEPASTTNNPLLTNCDTMISSQPSRQYPICQQPALPPTYQQKEYSNDVSAVFEMEMQGGMKRPYLGDFPSYPPPPYVDGRSEHHAPPNKRIRVDPQPYSHQYEPDFQPFDCFSFANIDDHRCYQQDGAAAELDVLHSQHNSYKNYSDDSGTGRSVISPTPINIPDDHYNLYSLHTPSPISSAISEYGKDLLSPLSGSNKQLTDLSASGSYTANTITHNSFGNPRQFCAQAQQSIEHPASMRCADPGGEKFDPFPPHSVKREDILK